MNTTYRPAIEKEKNRFTISFGKFKCLYDFRNFPTQGTTVFLRRFVKPTSPAGRGASNARAPFFHLLVLTFVCI